jgi:3-oxoacyl-[acyl-carrier-protein] synthase II
MDIVSCGAFTPAGSGLETLAQTLADEDHPAPVNMSVPDPEWPPIPALPVRDFVPESILGRKGLSRLSRSDQLAIAACTAAYGNAAQANSLAPGDTGIVLGTAVGSTGAMNAFLRDTFEQRRPYLVDAGRFPGTMMNSAAGNTAIRLGLTGVNATVSGGATAGLQALHYTRTVLAAGHVRAMLVGSVEELSAPYAWAWQHSRILRPGTALSEGCAVFGVTRPGDSGRSTGPVLGRILGTDLRCGAPGPGGLATATRLAESIRSLLERTAIAPGDVQVIVPGAQARRGWSALERRAIRDALGDVRNRRILHTHKVFGEAYGLGFALQLAGLLATWQRPAHPPAAKFALLTSAGIDGTVGCLLAAGPDSIR